MCNNNNNNNNRIINNIYGRLQNLILFFRIPTGRGKNFFDSYVYWDRLCGLVVRVSGYRYRGPGFDPRRYQIF